VTDPKKPKNLFPFRRSTLYFQSREKPIVEEEMGSGTIKPGK
jgi:hypothetical protein